ncbi:MAG TPA: TAXI family TRAP transporter solute-binding subunit [Verrucomicrobiae bacterium]|jgi:TRAP-type uncharacterized transport system substrate-binding protein
MQQKQRNAIQWMQAMFTDNLGLSPALSLLASALCVLVVVLAVFWFFHSAPPHTITITSGPPGSSFNLNATRFQTILKEKGVELKILPSKGSEENLERLQDRSMQVDIGFVQSSGRLGMDTNNVVSLGSVAFQPMLIFYRGTNQLQLLSEFKGKRLVIGAPGSGDRSLALTLLGLNGISNNAAATFVDLEAEAAAKALDEGSVDAIFLMGDSASSEVMRELLRRKDVHLFDVTQADGYVRRVTYLSKLELPKGSIDFGNDIPDHDISLVGPTVELLAKSDLHPVLSDMLLETAHQVFGKASLFRRQDEFPAPMERDFPLSDDATRFYKSGKKLLFRYMPYWLASLVTRTLWAFGPLVLVMVPAAKVLPQFLRWRIQLRIVRWYRSLLALEREVRKLEAHAHSQTLLARLDEIEEAVNKLKMPASYADQFYNLRGHIAFVRTSILQHGALGD